MTEIYTDCRDEDGITVGLIDAIINISRLLAKRDLSPPVVTEALRDLKQDEDMNFIMDIGGHTNGWLNSRKDE
jgi:hypothetical protein